MICLHLLALKLIHSSRTGLSIPTSGPLHLLSSLPEIPYPNSLLCDHVLIFQDLVSMPLTQRCLLDSHGECQFPVILSHSNVIITVIIICLAVFVNFIHFLFHEGREYVSFVFLVY